MGLAQRGGQLPLRAGNFSKLGHLEEVKVVTRSPLVNQRRDHYRVYNSQTHVNLTFSLLRRDRPGRHRVPRTQAPAGGLKLLYYFVFSEWITQIIKTFNNGSLGSGIDEERSEMRKVM